MDMYGEMPKRRAVGGRATDQYNLAQRDPMVHQIKGQLAAEKAMEGRGTNAAQYRRMQDASHAHMRGGRPNLAGGGFISDLGIPIISNLAGAIGLGRSGPSVTGGMMVGGRVVGGRPNLAGGARSMYSDRQLNNLARAIGGQQKLGRTHSKMVRELQGAGFFDDFKKGFMSVISPIASIAKPLLPMVAGPYGAAASAGLSALGLGRGEDTDEEEEEEMVEAVGGRRRRAKASPSDARRRRGAMVSKLMREQGMSLGEASAHIKKHGLA